LDDVDVRFRTRDGAYRWISWNVVPRGDHFYAAGRDVTERKALEEQLRQSQKLEAVGQLTGGVAHDFNNLLTVIKSSTDLLKRPNLPEERRTRYVDAISDTVARAAKLTGQLLAFARRQALQPEVFDVGRGVASVSDMVRTLTGARIQVDMQVVPLRDAAGRESPCLIDADPSQFDTALVNMVVNARDAMAGEGRITIRVQPVNRVPAVRAHPAMQGDFVAVSVTDTGTGIAPGDLERIFEPFFTTKGVGQGTGLGLSQVFGFAKQSGGEVVAESRLGAGSTFTLYLPRAVAAAVPEAEAPEPAALADGHGTCVLLVEDNLEVGAFAAQALQELGYSTVWATDAEKALREFERVPFRFEVVFSDVVMPGMNGVELAHEIRRRQSDLPVVLASGYSDVLAAHGTHGFELLRKPYSVTDLSRILRRAVERARSPTRR
ncbi:ATP-binding protein, partial [Methylobacterium mesophilicum]